MYLVINCVCVCMIVMYFVIFLSVICLDFYVAHFCKGYPSGIYCPVLLLKIVRFLILHIITVYKSLNHLAFCPGGV